MADRLAAVLDEHGELLEDDDGNVHLWLRVFELDEWGVHVLGLIAGYEWRLAQVPSGGHPVGRWGDEEGEPESEEEPTLVMEHPSRNPDYALHRLMGALKLSLADFRSRLESRGAELGLPDLFERFPTVDVVLAAFASPNTGWNGGAARWSLELEPDPRILDAAKARRADLGRLPLSQAGRANYEARLDTVIARHGD